MKTREEIIYGMCMTYRHDYGLVITPEESMYSLNSGVTLAEQQRIWNTMAQIYDNELAPLLDSARRVDQGQAITIPKSIEHAKAMWLVAENFVKAHSDESARDGL